MKLNEPIPGADDQEEHTGALLHDGHSIVMLAPALRDLLFAGNRMPFLSARVHMVMSHTLSERTSPCYRNIPQKSFLLSPERRGIALHLNKGLLFHLFENHALQYRKIVNR